LCRPFAVPLITCDMISPILMKSCGATEIFEQEETVLEL
jgi:hypothetical protein